ncbi:MAG: helix-turn-helix transcriptional regulator [Flavobacteriaceae bacterium]
MVLDHKKIEVSEKVVFETIICNTETTFNFQLNDDAYFIYVNHGHHVAISPNEIIEVPEGDLGIAVGKSLILKAYPNKKNQHYQVLIIHINRDLVAKAFGNNFPDISTSSENEFSKDMFTGKPCVISKNYVDGVLQYFYNQHIITEEILEIKIKEILLLLLSSKKAEEVALLLEHFVNKRTSSFKEVIETHVFSEISIEELSQLCNMSLSSFKRHFKKIYSTTPNEYIFDKRLENSKKLLATSEQSIDDIALLSGFKTTAHFSRKFKEKYSMPPSHYKLTLSDK